MVFENKVFVLQYLEKEQDNCGVESRCSVRWVVGVSKTAHNVITALVSLARFPVRDMASNSPAENHSPTAAKKHRRITARHLIITLTLTTQTKTLLIQSI